MKYYLFLHFLFRLRAQDAEEQYPVSFTIHGKKEAVHWFIPGFESRGLKNYLEPHAELYLLPFTYKDEPHNYITPEIS